MAQDNIFREVEEELRSDRMRALWRRYGPYVIGAAVAVVLVVAINEGWNWWRSASASKSSDLLYAALNLSDEGKLEEAQKALDTVVAEGSGGYPMLARFKKAGLLARQGDAKGAVAAYDELASGQSNPDVRSLALMLAANLLVDSGDVGAVETRVGGLVATNSPLRNSAREALGLANYKAGKLDEAQKYFQAIIDDPATPSDMRTRAQVYIAQLVAQGLKLPDNKPAEALGAGTAAPAPATPAPAQPAAPAATAPAPAGTSGN